MKKITIIILIMFFCGCERITKNMKHVQSGWTGLNRRVTLYGCDGQAIQSWEGKFMIELNGSSAAWIQ